MSLEERSNELDKKLEDNDIDNSIDILVKDAKRRRIQLQIVTATVIIDFILTIGLIFVSINTNNALIAAQNNKDALVLSCKSGNDFRVSEASLWNHILEIQPVLQNLTPEQQVQRDKTVADFKKYLQTTFATRDCNNIVKD